MCRRTYPLIAFVLITLNLEVYCIGTTRIHVACPKCTSFICEVIRRETCLSGLYPLYDAGIKGWHLNSSSMEGALCLLKIIRMFMRSIIAYETYDRNANSHQWNHCGWVVRTLVSVTKVQGGGGVSQNGDNGLVTDFIFLVCWSLLIEYISVIPLAIYSFHISACT